jgi:hypothetical protein
MIKNPLICQQTLSQYAEAQSILGFAIQYSDELTILYHALFQTSVSGTSKV